MNKRMIVIKLSYPIPVFDALQPGSIGDIVRFGQRGGRVTPLMIVPAGHKISLMKKG